MDRYGFDEYGNVVHEEDGHIKNMGAVATEWKKTLDANYLGKEVAIDISNAHHLKMYIEIEPVSGSIVNKPSMKIDGVTTYDFLGVPSTAYSRVRFVGDLSVFDDCIRGCFSNSTYEGETGGVSSAQMRALIGVPSIKKMILTVPNNSKIKVKVWKKL